MSLDAAIRGLFLVVLAVSASAALWHRLRHHAPLGLGVRGVPVRRDILVGAAIGAAGIALTTVLMLGTGHARFTGAGFDGTILVKGVVILGIAAVVEELAYRVLMLGGLYRLTGSTMLALFLSAAVFGLVHVTDSTDATVVSVLSNAVGGVMYGVAFVRTGRIWMAVGLHFAWNFAQGTVLGFVISGDDDYSGALAHVTTSGPDWLGGGGYGLEGSVVSLVGRALVIALVLAATRGRTRFGAPPEGLTVAAAGRAGGRDPR